MPNIAFIPDEERRLMRKEAQKTRDKNHARQLVAILMLHQGMTVTDVAKMLCPARSSVGRWINWFTLHGVEGLKSLRPGCATRRPVTDILQALVQEQTDNPVFYQDEVDIDLNPKIGADWMLKGQQKRIVTPGQNQTHYLAGTLHETVTRNHQCRYMWQLLERVNQFMNVVSPFPGSQHGLVKVER